MFVRYATSAPGLRSAHELLALGRRLMQTAAADDEPPPLALRERARLYRDGLMIA